MIDFSREVIFYAQFSIIFIMIQIYFKIVGSHHTLNIIVICKTYVAKEPIYRTIAESILFRLILKLSAS